MIAAVTAAFTIGTDVYLIRKSERELYSSLSAGIEQAQKNEKTEIGKDAPKDIARTEICVVKLTKNSDGEQTASTLRKTPIFRKTCSLPPWNF